LSPKTPRLAGRSDALAADFLKTLALKLARPHPQPNLVALIPVPQNDSADSRIFFGRHSSLILEVMDFN
jgi:hypothetical protein